MSRHYSKLIAVVMALSLTPLALRAQETFSYTYKGQTIRYEVLDENAKTVMTGGLNGKITGDLVLPAHPMNGDVEYTLVTLGGSTFFNGAEIKSVTIPSSVETIESGAFADCNLLESLRIPASVSSLSPGFAYRCSSLTSIEVEAGNRDYKSVDGIVYTIDGAELIQYPCGNPATSLTIPSTVKTIAEDSFVECVNLRSVVFPESIERIDPFAFDGCGNLKEVTFPKVAEIQFGMAAFSYCGLVSVIIPEGVTILPDELFKYAEKLRSITLPGTLQRLNWRPLGSCGSLEKIECYAVTPPDADPEAFLSTPVENVTLHVPEGCREAYKSAQVWNSFGAIVDDLKTGAGIDATAVAAPGAPRDIYTLQGILLKRNASQADVDALAPGLYIVGGSKLLRR